MKKVVVLGATGGMGSAIVRELCTRGIQTVAVARSSEKLKQLFGSMQEVEVCACDVFDKDALQAACKGADLVFHALNLPYQEWAAKQEVVMTHVLDAAKGAKLAVVDNIYAYGRSAGSLVKEDSSKHPHTKKGKIRKRVAELAMQANEQGIPTLVAHFPDFYGPNAESTYLHYTLQAVLGEKNSYFLGDLAVPREYVFTPDGAKAIVELALRPDTYGEHWNIGGAGVIAGHDIVAIIRQLTGYTKRVSTVGKGKLALAGLFNPIMRETIEMLYLTKDPVILSSEKYEARIGALPRTPYHEGIQQTIESMKAMKTLKSIKTPPLGL